MVRHQLETCVRALGPEYVYDELGSLNWRDLSDKSGDDDNLDALNKLYTCVQVINLDLDDMVLDVRDHIRELAKASLAELATQSESDCWDASPAFTRAGYTHMKNRNKPGDHLWGESQETSNPRITLSSCGCGVIRKTYTRDAAKPRSYQYSKGPGKPFDTGKKTCLPPCPLTIDRPRSGP